MAPVLVIAHRGASGTCPENTLAAFRRAEALGAHMIELDVQLTRDGEVVVVHDWTLARTTDGRDQKSTRLNSSHVKRSYAVFCLKNKKLQDPTARDWIKPDYTTLITAAPHSI